MCTYDPWTWLYSDNGKPLKRICYLCNRFAKRNILTYEELLSECYVKLPDYVNSYDPESAASLLTYVHRCLQWHLYRIIQQRPQEKDINDINVINDIITNNISDNITNVINNIDNCDEINNIDMSQLTPTHKYMLTMHDKLDYSYQEIANITGWSKSTVRNYHQEAINLITNNATICTIQNQ